MRDKATVENVPKDGGSKVGTGDGDQATSPDSSGAGIPVYIGNKLRALFDDVVSQPVPDHLLDLLKRLETEGGHD